MVMIDFNWSNMDYEPGLIEYLTHNRQNITIQSNVIMYYIKLPQKPSLLVGYL